ncbi:GroES-like protein [Lentinula aciculospora]|uniref:GroES-like protein n=1 Tax=Lentinula aciculospora TaxID=153920 RepID=A0A9W9A2X7_9AGAR|nr:GroES-like protein [Lentinula aciculospora]
MQASNYACVLTNALSVEVKEVPLPNVGREDVMVKIESTGICGSDVCWLVSLILRLLISADAEPIQLHLYNHFGFGKARMKSPNVLGHESAGTVVEVGPDVKDVAIGDRVCIEPTMFCRRCYNCKIGKTNVCRNFRQAGMEPTPGTLQQYYVCESDFVVKVPDSLSWEEAGCIQPLAIAVQLAKRAKFAAGQTVAVFGCGPLGALVMATARAYGVSKIIAIDISQKRVDFARSIWADYSFISPQKEVHQDYPDWAAAFKTEVMNDAGIDPLWGVDVAVEASGAESCMHAGVAFTRSGGTYIQAGLGRAINSFPTVEIVAKELDVLGSVRYTAGCFQTAIDLVASSKVDLKPLITAVFPLARSAEALEAVRKGDDLKVVIMNQQI